MQLRTTNPASPFLSIPTEVRMLICFLLDPLPFCQLMATSKSSRKFFFTTDEGPDNYWHQQFEKEFGNNCVPSQGASHRIGNRSTNQHCNKGQRDLIPNRKSCLTELDGGNQTK